MVLDLADTFQPSRLMESADEERSERVTKKGTCNDFPSTIRSVLMMVSVQLLRLLR